MDARGGSADDLLRAIFGEISAFLNDRKVVSEGELRMKIRECIASIADDARDALKRRINVSDDALEDVIFRSITTENEKISVFSPDMRTKINYQGEIFYCLPNHKFFADELERAFLRWAEMRGAPLKDIVEEFLMRCGYEIITSCVCERIAEEIMMRSSAACIEAVKYRKDRNAEEEKICVLIFPSIKFVPRFLKQLSEAERSFDGIIKIVVPTEKTPAPFISFFRDHSEDIPELSIWVVDTSRREVNPLCGIENDEEIERNFADAQRARRAVSMWMRRIPYRVDLSVDGAAEI